MLATYVLYVVLILVVLSIVGILIDTLKDGLSCHCKLYTGTTKGMAHHSAKDDKQVFPDAGIKPYP